MENLEKRLEALYIQKNKIEEEIELLVGQIKEEKEKKAQKKEFSKDEKIEIFRNLFVARYDIYAKKWVSRDGLKQGFFPVTATFQGEDYIPLTNKEIEEHLRGNVFLATYCINQKNLSKFVVFEIANEDMFKLQIALNSSPFNLLSLGLFSVLITAFILFLITLIYPPIEVKPFNFTGLSLWGIEIHKFYVSLLLSYILISVTIYLITKLIFWLFHK